MARRPAVAGSFYAAGRESLVESIEEAFLGPLGPGRLPHPSPSRTGNVVGLVCPHAGYIYSGSAAAFSYEALAEDGIPEVVVILGPNHWGLGAAVGISPDNEWQTPLGSVRTDPDIAGAIVSGECFGISDAMRADNADETKIPKHRGCAYARMDAMPHLREHSIEVQLPFLQYIGGESFRIVPISIEYLAEDDAVLLAKDLGAAIAEAVSGRSAVIIASSDMSHEEPQQTTHAKDALAIEQILKLDGPGLIRTVYEQSIHMCGAIATAVMLEACKALGATTARKLAYYTSGDVNGEFSKVVGYAAISVEKS